MVKNFRLSLKKQVLIPFACFWLALASACGSGSAPSTGSGGSIGFQNPRALYWGGRIAFLERPTSIVTGFPFTLSAWIRTTARGTQTITGVFRSTVANTFYRIGVQSGLPAIEASNTTLRTARGVTAITDGLWHHVVGVFAGTNQRTLYVDGTFVAQDATAASFAATSNRFVIGRNSTSAPDAYFGGAIDEVGLYSSALTDAQVQTLYNHGMPSDLAQTGFGFAAWWRLGELGGDMPGLGSIADASRLWGLVATGFTGDAFVSGAPVAENP